MQSMAPGSFSLPLRDGQPPDAGAGESGLEG
jgi:hypothetical protein